MQWNVKLNTVDEKRAILASRCAVEAAPELRSARHGSAVRFDDIMEALQTLDKQAHGYKHRRVLHRRRVFGNNNRSAAR